MKINASPATNLLELTNTLQPVVSRCLLGCPERNMKGRHEKAKDVYPCAIASEVSICFYTDGSRRFNQKYRLKWHIKGISFSRNKRTFSSGKIRAIVPYFI
jgi:hypothetical protein